MRFIVCFIFFTFVCQQVSCAIDSSQWSNAVIKQYPHCSMLVGNLFCYNTAPPENNNASSQHIHPAFLQFKVTERQVVDHTNYDPSSKCYHSPSKRYNHGCIEPLIYPKLTCEYSHKPSHNFTQTIAYNQHSIPLLLSKYYPCHVNLGFGNMLGFMYELIAFSVQQGLVYSRFINPHDIPCSSNTLLPGTSVSDIYRHLPQLVLPSLAAKAASVYPLRQCSTIARWPWESPTAYLYQHLPLLAQLNNEVIHRWQQHHHHHHRPPPAASAAASRSQALVIHYRCSDNVMHKGMGLLSSRYYRRCLRDIFSATGHNISVDKIIILTDSNTRPAASSSSSNSICAMTLAALESILQEEVPAVQQGQITIVTERSNAFIALSSYLTMYTAKILICSVSTFCFFAALGGVHNLTHSSSSSSSSFSYASKMVYMPVGNTTTLNLPTIIPAVGEVGYNIGGFSRSKVKLPLGWQISKEVLYKYYPLEYSSKEQFIDQVIESN